MAYNLLPVRLAACVVLICLVVVTPIAQSALTCSQLTNSLAPCLPYVRNGGTPASACCAGIKALQRTAKTADDRKAACKCIKSFTSTISGINYNFAAALPGKCGVNIPYKISPSTDCNGVY